MNNRIKSLRLKAGLTQVELAQLTGCNVRLISKYELGEADIVNMTLGTARALAEALGCKIEDLIA